MSDKEQESVCVPQHKRIAMGVPLTGSKKQEPVKEKVVIEHKNK